MEEVVLQRVKQFIEYKNMSINAFAKEIEMGQVTVNNYITEKRAISFVLIDAMLQHFPELSAEWLLRGEGNMLKTAESTFKYDLPEEEDCMGSFACTRPISPKVNALEDVDRILANEKALEEASAVLGGKKIKGDLDSYIRRIVNETLQEKFMMMVG